MISPKLIKLKGSQGSTLLMSVLILTTILGFMYVLADVSIRNVRQTSSLVNGEKAVLAAESVTEMALWLHFREKTDFEGNCDTNPPTFRQTTLGSTTLEHCKSTVFSNPYTFDLLPDDLTSPEEEHIREIYLVDRSVNPPGGANYSQISFTWVGGSGSIKVCEWSNSDCSQSPWVAHGTLNNSGATLTANLVPGRKYVVRIEGSRIGGFSVSARGVDGSGNPKGLTSDLVIVRGRASDFFSTRTWEAELAP